MLSGNPSKQEVFDFGLAAIIKQGKPAWNPKTRACEYRSEGGLKCVVGHMLPDDMDFGQDLSAGMFGLVAMPNFPKSLSWMQVEDMKRFLSGMQMCHDWAADGTDHFMPSFKERMRLFAVKHQLVYKESE